MSIKERMRQTTEQEEQILEDMKTRIVNDWEIYFSVGPGWIPLITELHENIKALCPNYSIIQIKEKFGGLRFYAKGLTEEARELVHVAERLSYEICEFCGEPGNTSTDAWKITLCEICKQEDNV